MRLFPLLGLLACSSPPECPEGWDEVAEGHCASSEATAEPDLQLVLDRYPCTDLATGDGTLDWEAMCAGQACVGGVLADFEAEFGAPDAVFGTIASWSNPSVFAFFDDIDMDGAIGADDTAGSFTISGGALDVPFAGTTTDGLGLAVPLACFADVYGPGVGVDVVPDVNGDWSATQITWFDETLAFRFVQSQGTPGLTESISFYGGL